METNSYIAPPCDMGDNSGSTNFRALFQSTLQGYEKNTGIDLVQHPLAIQIQNCHSVESITALLQDQTRASSDFGRKDRIIDPIKNIISIISTLSGTTALGWAIGLTFSPENAIHAGIAILLVAAKGIEIGGGAVVDVLESVERLFRHLDIYTRIPHSLALDEMVVKIVMEMLSILALATKQLTRGQTRFVKNHFEEEDVEVVQQRLGQPAPGEAWMTAPETPKAVHWHGVIEYIDVVMDNGNPSVQEAGSNESKHSELQSIIRDWLSPPNPLQNHHIARKSRHEGSAMWFIEGEMFSGWKAPGRNSLLWIHGKPGAGKSVLCSTIIEEVEAMRKSGLALLAFYYYDFRDDQQNNLRGLLSSVLFQLCDQSESYHDIVSTFYSTHSHGAQCPSDNELALCLKELLKLPGQAPVYLIIDALDECLNTPALASPREKVLSLVEDLIDSRLANLHIGVTSRPELDIKVSLQPLSFYSVSIHDEIGQLEDIENYIKSVVKTNRKMQRWTAEHKQLVIDALTNRADGMFRWVYCQLEYLGDCIPGRIPHALDELPGTLDGTYERTLEEIKATDREFARRLFQCVAVAARPLRAEELVEFLAFDFKAGPIPKFREEWRLEDPLQAVLSTCSTLLALVNVDGSPVIQFSHFSVKEFLTSPRFDEKRDTISCHYYVSMIPAHTLVAQACLGILLHLDGNVSNDVLKKFPLAEYAGEHWVVHACFEGVLGNAELEEGLKRLFDRSKRHLAIWVWICDPRMPLKRYNRPEKPLPPRGSSLHYAVFCGLHSIVKFLAKEHPKDVHSRDFDHKSTPLHLATGMGHAEVARLLIEHGSDTTAKDEDGSTPLHLAVKTGREDLARLLLEHGANAAAKSKNGTTLLHLAVEDKRVGLACMLVEHGALANGKKDGSILLYWAVKNEREDFARTLLEHGANANVDSDDEGYMRPPLYFAVESGREDVVRLLLEHGANVIAKDLHGCTPLYLAVQNGREDLARLLLEHAPNATAKNKYRQTLLHLAVKKKREGPVHVPFEHGAHATTKNKYVTASLLLAVWDGREDLVRLFIEHGADVTAKGNDGWTVLHLAAQNGREGLARLLIQHGADVTAKNKYGTTPLHMALARGEALHFLKVDIDTNARAVYEEVESIDPRWLGEGRDDTVRLLVEHGADVTAKMKDGSTPLHLAVQDGREDQTRFLLEFGADATVKDKDGSTPLHLAVQNGREDLTRILLEHGANTIIKDKYGSTVLHSAVTRGEEGLTRLLIDHGADLAAKDKNGWTPLHCVLRYNKGRDLAYLLLEHGADVTAKDKNGWTPLHHVVRYHEGQDLVQLLFEHGADATAEDKDGRTLLQLAVEMAREDFARLLLEHGADATTKDKDKSTPFHLAVQTGREDLVRLLIEHGANPNAKDKHGSSPLHLAIQQGREDLAQACTLTLVRR